MVLRPYIREYRPVMLGVDGGADALLEAGYTPDIIVGDMDSVSDAALGLRRGACRARLPRRAGARPGAAAGHGPRLGACFPAAGTSEDIALLLADDLRRQPDRRRRHALHPDRVPRQGPFRWIEHVADPAAGGQQARRAKGREQALPEPDFRLVAARSWCSPRSSRCSPGRAPRSPHTPMFEYFRAKWDTFLYWLTGLI